MANIEVWLLEYGIFAIFLLLALGIIGLPIPDETLIVVAGILVSKGKLSLIPTLLAVYAGGLTGITLSYILGYTGGYYLVERFGYLIGIKPDKIVRTKKWFKETGKWALLFCYFIIGLRHLAGFISGMMKLPYSQFALFAYPGLLIWANFFFIIGYSFSHYAKHLSFISYMGILVAILALAALYGYFFYKQKK